MNPIKAQRTWHSLSTKWINAVPFGPYPPPRRRAKSGRKMRKGVLMNLIPVELVNAITGEILKGYMRDISKRKLKQWLGYHNQRAEVEQVYIPEKNIFFHLKDKEEVKDIPVLVKLDPSFQVPYLVDHTTPSIPLRGRPTHNFYLRTVDNLKYLELVTNRKRKVMNLFNKIRKSKKKK